MLELYPISVFGRFIPYFIGTEAIVNIAACTALTVIFSAIAWWWWAMDTINEITKMFKTQYGTL